MKVKGIALPIINFTVSAATVFLCVFCLFGKPDGQLPNPLEARFAPITKANAHASQTLLHLAEQQRQSIEKALTDQTKTSLQSLTDRIQGDSDSEVILPPRFAQQVRYVPAVNRVGLLNKNQREKRLVCITQRDDIESQTLPLENNDFLPDELIATEPVASEPVLAVDPSDLPDYRLVEVEIAEETEQKAHVENPGSPPPSGMTVIRDVTLKNAEKTIPQKEQEEVTPETSVEKSVVQAPFGIVVPKIVIQDEEEAFTMDKTAAIVQPEQTESVEKEPATPITAEPAEKPVSPPPSGMPAIRAVTLKKAESTLQKETEAETEEAPVEKPVSPPPSGMPAIRAVTLKKAESTAQKENEVATKETPVEKPVSSPPSGMPAIRAVTLKKAESTPQKENEAATEEVPVEKPVSPPDSGMTVIRAVTLKKMGITTQKEKEVTTAEVSVEKSVSQSFSGMPVIRAVALKKVETALQKENEIAITEGTKAITAVNIAAKIEQEAPIAEHVPPLSSGMPVIRAVALKKAETAPQKENKAATAEVPVVEFVAQASSGMSAPKILIQKEAVTTDRTIVIIQPEPAKTIEKE